MTVAATVQFALATLVALSGLAALVRIPGIGGTRGLLQFAVSAPALHIGPALLLTLVVSSAACAAGGGLDSKLGLAGLATSLVAMVELLVLQRRAGFTAVALERSLQEVFGADFRRSIPRERATMRDAAAFGLNPFRVRLGDVERIEDLSYGDAGERNLLDVYRPKGPRSGMPVLLAIHGGGWTTGHKAQQGLAILNRMASGGWLVVAINYRLGPQSRFPDPLIDVKRAIAWIRMEARRFGGNPDFVVACGQSAGGHLAALAALTPNLPEYQPGFEHADTSLRGVVTLYSRLDITDRWNVAASPELRQFLVDNVMPCPYEDDPRLWESASPIARVHPDMPPFFVLHGTHDSLIPIEEAQQFVRAARESTRSPVAYAALHGAQHSYDLANSRWTHRTAEAMFTFGEWLLADANAAAGGPASPVPSRDIEGPE